MGETRVAYRVGMQRWGWVLAAMLAVGSARAQWQILASGSTADLRGIHSVGQGVAWASGTQGTVLRTTDEGKSWERCATPPGAEGLDFRGVQAFDASTAIVMSSGKGALSRLYKTTDGCKSWRLMFTNPDADGFWDAIKFAEQGFKPTDGCFGVVLGDPIDRHFPFFLTYDCGEHWERQIRESPEAEPEGESIFAASNSSMVVEGLTQRTFVTGGRGGPRIIGFWVGGDDTGIPDPLNVMKGAKPFHFVSRGWDKERLQFAHPSDSSGAFSYAKIDWHQVIVGGDYASPDRPAGTAWYVDRSHPHYDIGWTPSKTTPHGYRSAVAYDAANKTWITVGPNGTDVSTDDGRNWRALRPNAAAGEAADADQHWNALSLPFVVGPKGRIGKLRAAALNGVKP
jgi:hypothetical protein